MPFNAAQLEEIRSAIFESPLMLAGDALHAIGTCYEQIKNGGSDVTPKSAVHTAMDSPTRTQHVGTTAVIPLTGPLAPRPSFFLEWVGGTSTESFLRDVRNAMSNPDVTSVLFYVDSPGGMALGNEEVAQAIRGMRGTKPMAAFVKGYCASAALYIAAAADKVYATPSSIIGSVGAIIVHTEYSQMRKNDGITDKVYTNSASPLKGRMNPYAPMSAEHEAATKSYIDKFGEQFIAAMAVNRGVTRDVVISQFGKGDVYMADEAKQRGMIDKMVPDLNAAIAELSKQPKQVVTVGGKSAAGSAANLSFPGIELQIAAAAMQLGSFAPSAGTAGSTVPVTSNSKEISIVNKKIKAALFCRGLIGEMEASDDVCQAALNAYFAGQGGEAPKEEAAILAALNAGVQKPEQQTTASNAPAPNVAAAHKREMEEAKNSVKLDGAQTIELRRQLVASATIFNRSGEMITPKQIDDAVEDAVKNGGSYGDIVQRWTDTIAKEKPVAKTDIQVSQKGAEQFVADASEAMFMKMAFDAEKVPPSVLAAKPTDSVKQLMAAPLWHVAKQSLQIAGERFPEYGMDTPTGREQIVSRAMSLGGQERQTFYSPRDARMDGVAFNRPGDFPNILSNLANKLLDMGVELEETTYAEWTGVWPSELPDFKPAPVMARSPLKELNEVLDAEASKELKFTEELMSFIFLRRFSNKVGLTPLLVANDDLGAFAENTIDLGGAWERTINTLCLLIPTGNAALLDGYSLFDDTNHGNDLTSGNGGSPSQTQSGRMNLKFRKQTGVGAIGRSRARFRVALIPPDHEDAADAIWLPFDKLPELKVAATDATISTYRGKVKAIVEPDLLDYSSSIWYGFADPKRYPAVVRAYFKGWGRGGQRQRWYDPNTKTTYIELEGRIGAAAKNYRYATRNNGS